MRYFTLSEFDSPDLPGSGEFMDEHFLNLLDLARDAAKVPFVISSGFRTEEYSQELKERGYKVANKSAHLKGLAADIRCYQSQERHAIIEALLYVGFRRIGISDTFIHVDLDKDKAQDVIWLYI